MQKMVTQFILTLYKIPKMQVQVYITEKVQAKFWNICMSQHYLS